MKKWIWIRGWYGDVERFYEGMEECMGLRRKKRRPFRLRTAVLAPQGKRNEARM
jgi:hypothetical protein